MGLPRSTAYYRPRPEDEMNVKLKEWIDKQYTARPYYGVPRMTVSLRQAGWKVNAKRVARLMREMGLRALCPKPHLSMPDQSHTVYPYLLRDLAVERPDQVWASDITYIRLRGGFVYLTAVMDWYSRAVLSWELSNTLDAAFCVAALERALRMSQPEIFNSDQGCQYTSRAFTEQLTTAGVRISMDGRGRAFDNIFVERLWRTVKYEEVYLKEYASPVDARHNLEAYFRFYNHERPHQSLDWRTPMAVYWDSRERWDGVSLAADAAGTPVGLRPPSVPAAGEDPLHINLEIPWS
jgi:putative transposase